MARIVIVTHKKLLKQRTFSSVKKACEEYELDYRAIGDALRDEEKWENDDVLITRLTIE